MNRDNFIKLPKSLPQSFFNRDTVTVAKELLGKTLISFNKDSQAYLISIISETESYRSDDPASHCYNGITKRNKAMFGPVGHSYVYQSYGIHYCLNVTARDITKYKAGGALIRGAIPVHNKDIMLKNRTKGQSNKILEKDISNGPGKLTQAFGIKIEHNNVNMTSKNSIFYIGETLYNDIDIKNKDIDTTERIGISRAKDYLWRFILNSEIRKKIKSKIQDK